jgi:LmbE family N-acetylglucosaminyl deacetylase
MLADGSPTSESPQPSTREAAQRRLSGGGRGIRPLVLSIRQRLMVAADGLPTCKQVVLVVVSHPDDEVLGPGALLAALSAQRETVAVFLVVLAARNRQRRAESQHAAKLLGLPNDHVFLIPLPDGRLATHGEEIRLLLRTFADNLRPDVVLTHSAGDIHPDHATACAAVRHVFCRDAISILHFRVPYPMPGPWDPRVFFKVPEDAVRQKVDGDLFSAYPSQNWKDFFNPELHRGSLVAAGYMTGGDFAEWFEVSKLCLEVSPSGDFIVARNAKRGPSENA